MRHRIGTWWSIALVRPAAASQIFFVEACETRKERAIVDGSAEQRDEIRGGSERPKPLAAQQKSFQPCVDRIKKLGIYFKAQLKTQRKTSKSQTTGKSSKANQ
jgi:hypothetical protein